LIMGGAGGAGGSGVGGDGGLTGTGATSGAANTGSGGGGGGNAAPYTSGAGADGVVIFAYEGTVTKATGGTITDDGVYTYHTFTSPGSFVFTG
jgi:hypothetical protein